MGLGAKAKFGGLVFASFLAVCAARADDEWIQVESENFVVTTDASEKSGRQLVEELETVRVVFRIAISGLPQGAPPLDVLAAKNEDSFEKLVPQIAAEEDRFLPTGVFFRTTDKPWVVVNLGARDENRFATVYHEYFHSLAFPAAPRAPLWFHEGMASMWENTQIRRNDVSAARPSQLHLEILANEQLMGLRELLLVDHTSPAYREAHRATIFYAQSWALMHFLFLSDKENSLSSGLGQYLSLLDQGHDPIDAFERSFAPLEKIEPELRHYIRRRLFKILRVEKPATIDPSTLRLTALSAGRVHARFGSYFAHTGQYEDALEHLERAVELAEDDPIVHESRGVIHYRQGRYDEAERSFKAAAALDETRFLTNFYLAILTARSDANTADVLRFYERSVNANPFHAPSLGRLALIYGANSVNIQLALGMARRAAALAPDDPVSYLAVGVTARASGKPDEAVAAFQRVLQIDPSMEIAKTQLDELRAKSEQGRK